MNMWPKNRHINTVAVVATGLVAALGMAACGSSGSSTGSNSGTSASAKQTIVFATAGLGTEGTATKTAITGFEKAHPNITVNLLPLSSSSTSAQQQEQNYFVARPHPTSSTPT